MNFSIDNIQEKKIRVLFGAVAFLGGVTAILYFFQRQKINKEQKKLIELEIKVKKLHLKELEEKAK